MGTESNLTNLMKNVKVSLLVLSVLAGGAMAASAAAEIPIAFGLDMRFTNGTAVWSISGGPVTTSSTITGTTPEISVDASVSTDESGKIMGGGLLFARFASNGVPSAALQVSVSGNISSKSGTPTVTLMLKGKGFASDGTNATEAQVSLKFVGTPGPDPFNTNSTRIVGTLTGKITGTSPFLPAKSVAISAAAVIESSRSNTPDISGLAAETSKKIVWFGFDFDSSGAVTGSKTKLAKAATAGAAYKIAGRGDFQAKGLSFTVTGSLGTVSNFFGFGTNAVSIVAPTDATLKGKSKGQSVTGTASYPTTIDIFNVNEF